MIPETSSTIQNPPTEQHVSSYKIALLILAVLYFMLGFITVLNDTLVPFFKEGFNLSYAQSSLVQFYFFLTYGLISIPAGKIVDRIGYKKGMVLGFCIAAFGALLFYPASVFHQYGLFLGALFVIAMGIVLLQVSANPYITILGPAKSAASRLTFIQGVGSLGTTLAPIFGAQFILAQVAEQGNTSSVLVKPYLIIGSGLFLIGIIIFSIKLPVVKAIQKGGDELIERLTTMQVIQLFLNLKFGIFALFMYVGAEVGIGTYLTNYIADRLSIPESSAGFYLSYYWGGMLVGRFLGAFFLQRFQSRKVLFVVSFIATILILSSIITHGHFSVWCMVLAGFCNSIMFATIFSLSIAGLGNNTGTASGLLSTAIVGGAIITYLQGVLKDEYSWEAAFVLPILSYVVIMCFSVFLSSSYPHKSR